MMIDCSKCRYFYGYDGVGELWTGCSIHGDFKGQKRYCNHFEKKVTKSDLLNKIQSLEKENEQLKKRNKFLEEFDGRAKTVANLKEENEQLRKELGDCEKFRYSVFKRMGELQQ